MLGNSTQRKCLTPKNGEKLIFPNADGTVKLSGGDQVLTTSTSIQDNPDRGEEQGNLLGESDGSPPPLLDRSPIDGEARSNFWSISGNYIYSHHVEPRVKLYVPREKSFPIPLRYFDVTRATCTTSDVTFERRMGGYWNIEGNRDLSGTWTGFNDSPYWTKNFQMDTHGLGSVWRKNKRHPDLIAFGQRYGTTCQKQREEKKNKKWAIEKPKLDNARRLRAVFNSLIQQMRSLKKLLQKKKKKKKKTRRKLEVPMPAAMSRKIREKKVQGN